MSINNISTTRYIVYKPPLPIVMSKALFRLLIIVAAILLTVLIINSYFLNNSERSKLNVGLVASATPSTPAPPAHLQNAFITYLPLTTKRLPNWAISYYVDSNIGSDAYSCENAINPETPKKTVSSVMACNPGPGQKVLFRGTFNEPLLPNISGAVLYNVQDIASVDGSTVTFNHSFNDIYPSIDYVTIYGSRKGNSGAFLIVSINQNKITVDTQSLPGGQFLPETESDPGNLQAAVLRPVHFTAWDKNNLPVWNTDEIPYISFGSVIMVSHLKLISGYPDASGIIWPAVQIGGFENTGINDFNIVDHMDISRAGSAIALGREPQSNYDIIQYNNIHDLGTPDAPYDNAIIYWGIWGQPTMHHDFVQIMYNHVGPHIPTASFGDGIDTKQSSHNFTIFGNEVVGINSNACGDAPIKTEGQDGFIANNFVHDISPSSNQGCGISIVDVETSDSTSGAARIIVANNIIANVPLVGISVVDANDIQILNNTIYNITLDPNCKAVDCSEWWMGIRLHNWNGPMTGIVIKNNIVQNSHIGIGRYVGSHDEFPVSIDSDYNIVFAVDYPFRGSIEKNMHDLVVNPLLVDPQNYNFSILDNSPARDSGINLSSVFDIDNHDATDPTWPVIIAPTIRINPFDRGAYDTGQ